MSLQRPSLTRRNALKAVGVGGASLFGLLSVAAADDIYTRVGGGSTPSLTASSRLDADSFYSFVDEMADIYSAYGVFGISVPLTAEFAGAWTDGFVRPLDGDAFDGMFRANAAVVSYRLASDEFVHLTWVAGRVDDTTYNPDPVDLIRSPMRLTRLGASVDVQDGDIESASYPHRDGGGWVLTFDTYRLRYPSARATGNQQVRTSQATNPMLRGTRAATGSDGVAHVEWDGYGPSAFAIASAFTTRRPLSDLDVEWNWTYGIGTEGPI
ncbi:hypothetical protein SAMN04487950_2037 [Halogranum rubrum]|uniref:Uncharacterized protein n=1 Tax=Halogranum rubrum TaxID=553466 RepID=A0A1I4EAJ7_9EURY|nr:hypothetical protein [Halogranum rubrum]SFL02808.1 hypothetical protein SAMN04487950_2037 [Halogranum rubrum]